MKAFNLQQARENKDKITELYLHNLQLKEVPTIVFDCPNLEVLEISKNQIREISGSFTQLSSLRRLNFSNNLLLDLPNEFSRLQLIELDISCNKFQVFPNSISKLGHLEVLKLSNNQIVDIPPEISQLIALRVLEIDHNQIQDIPKTVEKLINLRQVNLAGNLISRLPVGIGNWMSIEKFDIGRNRLKRLPDPIKNWSRLSTLKVGFNRLTELPDSLSSCMNLRKIEANNNRITSLLSSIGKLQWLAYLYLSKNKLNGLPASIERCQQLQVLDLSKNEFDNIGTGLGYLSRLIELDLSYNSIQKWPSKLPVKLKSLNLKKNLLQKIPFAIKQFEHLESLQLEGNNISKEALQALVHLKRLKSLRGLLPYQEKRAFIRFLSQLNHHQVFGKERDRLFKLFFNDYTEADQYELPLFIKALNFKSPKFQEKIKTYLFELNLLDKNPLQKGNTLTCLGKTTLSKKNIGQKLVTLDIGFSSNVTNETTHVLLGKPPISEMIGLKKSIVFLSEQMLKTFLDESEEKHLISGIDKAKIQNLKRFLLSTHIANIELAVQLLKGGGVPKALLTALFIAWKKVDAPALKKELHQLLELHLLGKAKQLMNYPFHLHQIDREKLIDITKESDLNVDLLIEYLTTP